MYVHEECVGFPAAHFLDCVWVDAIEVHCHGTASSEGVAAHIALIVAECVEADGTGSVFEGSVDVLGSDGVPARVERVGKVEKASGGRAGVAENVMNPGGKRFDWAVIGAGAFLVDALAFDAIFLIRHSDGGFGCCEQKL